MNDDIVFTSLRLRQFRSYEDFVVELDPSVNIVVGPNASGKTNLLESILILCGNNSYRANYGDLISNNQTWARIDANLGDSERVVKIKKNETIEKTYEIDGKTKKRLTFNDIFPIVLFEPEHMRLITGSPNLRRDFFDSYLSQTDPEFNKLKSDYTRVLAQRNKLLKLSKSVIESQIFAWNIRLSELGGNIFQLRINLINKLNARLSEVYSQIAMHKTDVQLNYLTNLQINNYESSLLSALENNIDKDILRGFTSYGPHREDIEVKIHNSPAQLVASRGETRTLVLGLKLLEGTLLQESRNTKPIILLDDVFSELDGSRRTALTQYLKDYQTIITTTDADVVAKNFAQKTNLISLI